MIARFFIAFIVVLTILNCAFSQNLLDAPESVVFDSLNNRYIISNWGHGDLVTIDQFGFHEYLIRDEECYAGLYIQDNVLYVSCRDRGVKAFDLATNEKILDMTIPGTTNLNDIVADTSGNLYVSYPTGDAIFKINIATEEWSTFVDEGLQTPNGMYFDAVNNRLLVISYRSNSPIQGVNLSDSTLSVVRTTTLDNLDGLACDTYGYYYVSSWQTNNVYRFNPDFEGDPVEYVDFNDDPADIYINPTNNELAVPLFFSSSVEFVEYQENEVRITEKGIPFNYGLKAAYPNPFNPSITIPFSLQTESNVKLYIYNVMGQEVATLLNSYQKAGDYKVSWDGKDTGGKQFSSGTYYIKLITPELTHTKRITLVK